MSESGGDRDKTVRPEGDTDLRGESGSARYHGGSEGMGASAGALGSEAAEARGTEPPDEGEWDPFVAMAQAESERKPREQNDRPTIWLPGQEELDAEPGDPGLETYFNTDNWSGCRSRIRREP